MSKRWSAGMMAVALALCAALAGCTKADAVKVAGMIHTYVPTVMALANEAATLAAALDPAEAKTIAAVSAKVQAELKELENVSGAYAAAPSAGAWLQLTVVVDQLVSDADNGLLAAVEIKNPATQAKVKIALGALDAAVHVVDGYLAQARTPAETRAAMAQRKVKLAAVTREWSAADWQRAEAGLDGRARELAGAAARQGF